MSYYEEYFEGGMEAEGAEFGPESQVTSLH